MLDNGTACARPSCCCIAIDQFLHGRPLYRIADPYDAILSLAVPFIRLSTPWKKKIRPIIHSASKRAEHHKWASSSSPRMVGRSAIASLSLSLQNSQWSNSSKSIDHRRRANRCCVISEERRRTQTQVYTPISLCDYVHTSLSYCRNNLLLIKKNHVYEK